MSTEISTHTTPARGLALQSMADAMTFGKMVSESDFAPKDFRGKPASCVLAIQAGAEIGLSPMQALQSIAVVNGRPSIFGDAALAVVKASTVCEYVTEAVEGDGDLMVATCTAKRRGYPQPTVVQFSVADAKKAGLWGKSGPWTQYPRRMLQMRARGFALRDAFPDCLRGIITAEEAQDYPTPEAAREPVMVRPQGQPAKPSVKSSTDAGGGITVHHVESFGSDGPPKASETDMERSRLAVSRAKTLGEVERMQSTTEKRLKDGYYTPAQADELLNLINGKLDLLMATPSEVAE